jgi:hypothetical protein
VNLGYMSTEVKRNLYGTFTIIFRVHKPLYHSVFISRISTRELHFQLDLFVLYFCEQMQFFK